MGWAESHLFHGSGIAAAQELRDQQTVQEAISIAQMQAAYRQADQRSPQGRQAAYMALATKPKEFGRAVGANDGPQTPGALSPTENSPTVAPPPNQHTIYSPSQCIGAVVNGVCHGTIMPDAAYHPTCYGEMVNGICTGPMF